MRVCRLLIALMVLVCSFTQAWAKDLNRAQIFSAVDAFVLSQTAGLPGKVKVSVGSVDPELSLAGCKQIDPYVPAGFRLWGESTVRVKCLSGSHWNISVPVRVAVIGSMLVAARPLSSGQVIGPGDLAIQTADLTKMPPDILHNPENALGKVVSSPVMAGYVLRSSMLHLPWVVFQGRPVKLVATGTNFRLTSMGQALGNAWPGQEVRVRVQSGKIVTGVVQGDGSVRVSY
ncbi:MAG: flagellar basal body P-ring formation protein FlgA [Proteobacteria bacterium]|nr:flagellar basal body P-ring formation protein FlgA [Pseudomonadota bacterium]MDE3208738.1 flagellar basal body P-ring formation protein FlgA [Pseudomonadota bacterium]